MFKSILKLDNYMKGNRTLYLMGGVAMALATLFSLFSPLVLRFTLDNVIGDEKVDFHPSINGFLSDLLNSTLLADGLWVIAGVMIAITLVQGGFLYLKGKLTAIASENMAKKIRDKLYSHIQKLPFEYHVKTETGDLVQRCTSDVDTIRMFLASQLVEVARAVMMVGIAIPLMLSLDTTMTYITFFVIPIIFGFSVVFFLKIRSAFQESDETEGKLSTILQENLTGVKVVRAFARERFEIDKFEDINGKYRDTTYKLINLLAWYWSVSDLFCLLQIGVTVVAGAYFAVIGNLTVGTFLVFTTYVSMLLWPIRQMGRILTDMGKSIVSINRIEEVLTYREERKEYQVIKPYINGDIQIRDLSFAYENSKDVLKSINLDIKAGSTVAILGSTGAGKSTLVNILCGLFDYDRGSVRVGGCEMRNIDKDWLRTHITLILQEPFLFSRTIKDNLLMADDRAKEDKLIESTSVANIHHVIEDFSNGYNTKIGENGVNLSGGQRQRLAIARSLLKNSPIIIFDDSLSAVDTETDLKIRSSLSSYRKDQTKIIISHRITTVMEADKIVVMDQGKIVQEGTHSELLKQDGIYKRVYDLQTEQKEDKSYEDAGLLATA